VSQQLPRFGLFPGQRAALRRMMKKADKFDRFRQRTRRALLATVVGSVAACGAAWFGGWRAGRSAMAAPPDEPNPGLAADPLLDLANGPLVALERQSMHLLRALHGRGEGDPLWLGYYRLTLVATQQGHDTPLRRQLLEVGERSGAPAAAREAAAQLRQARR
jgi:hypothetical protein